MVSAQSRPNASAPEDGSRTITVHDQSAPETPGDDAVERAPSDGALRLRGGPRSRPRVAWDERVVDNENCGRKKSKICCIYHKPREFDESSSESSSGSESESESSESDSDVSDDGRARPRRRNSNCHRHHRPHPPAHRDGASPPGGGSGLRNGDPRGGVAHEIESHREPNAYEVQPSHSKKGKGLADS